MQTSPNIESNPSVSPTQSPTLGPAPTRRLSVRRGSVSALDPWGEHADVNLSPTRECASRLTIVRVPPPVEPEESRRHRRNASLTSTTGKGEPGRMSFAFSSFSPPGAISGRASPPSPRIRPTTPGSPRQSFSLPPQPPRLSPEQLVELARQSVNPRPAIAGPNAPVVPSQPSPVSFTPLPDSVYLPFIERPAEVSQLISQPPTNKLFVLLGQTSSTPSTSPIEYLTTDVPPPPVESDPKQWSFQQLISWLRNVDRDVADDIIWVRKARAYILERSELIWERVRGALGVPPELNVDDEELEASLRPLIEPTGGMAIPRPRGEAAWDVPVFEPDSPVSFTVPLSRIPGEPTITAATPQEPGFQGDIDVLVPSAIEEISVEPVIAAPPSPHPPPPSSTTHTSLEGVMEEEEEELGEPARDKDSTHLDVEVVGIRFSTSPAPVPIVSGLGGISPNISPSGTASAGSVSSHGHSASSSPVRASVSGGIPRSPLNIVSMPRSPPIHGIGRSSSFGSTSGDEGYDANFERGPGRPLFPSNFAQLSLGPTFRNRRAQSDCYSAPPSFGLRRAGGLSQNHPASASLNLPSHSASAHSSGVRGMFVGMPSGSDYDMGRHEYAVSTGSTSAAE
ncbi:unnamed protein product [Somion occarium]|uniref:Uncharacterized protein n=1 Tax=Somion occarium TaxID=3059160 RepID=A0ABP1E593_9APHY